MQGGRKGNGERGRTGYGSLLPKGKDGSWVRWGTTKGPPRPLQLEWKAQDNDARRLPRERQERWPCIPDMAAVEVAQSTSSSE
jgi:hypothetical protein